MLRLVVFLLAAIALGAATRSKRARPSSGDAFAFPTTESHEHVDLDEPASVARWCSELGCDEARLRTAVRNVGASIGAIRGRLAQSR